MKDGETERRCEHEHEREHEHEHRHERGCGHQVSTREGEPSRGAAARVVRRAAGRLARPGVSDIAYSAVAVLLALVIGAILIAASGYSVIDAYANLFDGAFGSIYNFANTLMMATPLLFTGLSVAVAFQCGLFNVGAEGQLYVGGLASAVVVLVLGPAVPGVVRVLLALVAGALAGAVLAAGPGYMKARLGAHEVITTIMLNYVGVFLTTFLVKTYLKEPGPVDQTPLLPVGARLPELIPGTRVSWGIVLGVAAVMAVDYILRRTSVGYEIQTVGRNAAAAEYAGVNVPGRIVLAMVMSGAIAGLAGSSVVMGTLYRFITNFSPGYGFTGIAVAVLARNKPWGVLPAALLFGMLQSGGMSMQLFARIPADLMTLVQGIVILFVAAPALASMFLARSRAGAGTGGRG
ncbi:MAG: ABC transporter permease [Firmicutes bacterium]|nr:ABC transporter permease [Bacillota bacterium]